MPHKSKRKLYQNRKAKSRQPAGQSATPPLPSAASGAPGITAPVAQPKAQSRAAARPANFATPEAALAAARYPHVGSELKRIAILTGIVMVILIALSFILPSVA